MIKQLVSVSREEKFQTQANTQFKFFFVLIGSHTISTAIHSEEWDRRDGSSCIEVFLALADGTTKNVLRGQSLNGLYIALEG